MRPRLGLETSRLRQASRPRVQNSLFSNVTINHQSSTVQNSFENGPNSIQQSSFQPQQSLTQTAIPPFLPLQQSQQDLLPEQLQQEEEPQIQQKPESPPISDEFDEVPATSLVTDYAPPRPSTALQSPSKFSDSLATPAMQTGQGTILDCLVTIYGISITTFRQYILPIFEQLGTIVTIQYPSDDQSTGYWIVIEYDQPHIARQALQYHGAQVGQHLFGVKKTSIHELSQPSIDRIKQLYGQNSLFSDQTVQNMTFLQANKIPHSYIKSAGTMNTSFDDDNMNNNNKTIAINNDKSPAVYQSFLYANPYDLDARVKSANDNNNNTIIANPQTTNVACYKDIKQSNGPLGNFIDYFWS